MNKISYSSICNLTRAGAGVKLSARTYNASEIATIANTLDSKSFLIIIDASEVTAGTLMNCVAQHDIHVVLDFT
ncbi:hypothetical protein [Saccharibacter floricola]|uniref:Uncharacterized protein n=1 Tax=Saccharibacter floricola DSM 15669 TaxID=1123227 RepID=A0ABQ0P170_9PROT|nr:hypothetical protein [Saccharibacter floricola]GBQ08874.1 hypothetical protein AA15669_1944 [Saccharibacter floricola DSM 15669]